MPLSISIDTSGLEERIADMCDKLKEFPQKMGDELTAWQTEDMHRKYPNTTVTDDSASTEIWPHSRLPEKNKPRKMVMARSRRVRGLTRAQKPTVKVKGQSTRPILREELYEKLDERMVKLMGEELEW